MHTVEGWRAPRAGHHLQPGAGLLFRPRRRRLGVARRGRRRIARAELCPAGGGRGWRTQGARSSAGWISAMLLQTVTPPGLEGEAF